MSLTEKLIDWTERGLVPDVLVRTGIRRLLRKRLNDVDQGDCESNQSQLENLILEFNLGPIAPLSEKANEQHYEVPAEFFTKVLGPRKKYSSCYYPEGVENLSMAEDAALTVTCQRAELKSGQNILELGCGWGSLSLWMATQYPESTITAVSNSNSQREYIMARAAELDLSNLTVVTCDMNEFDTDVEFDRVVSVEMFEHMRNYRRLMKNIARWLKPDGKLFVHIFCHKHLTYKFEDQSSGDWMSRYFFSGGIMPGDDLLWRFQEDVAMEKQWRWNGRHYQRTCEDWLRNMDLNRAEIMPVLERTYGKPDSIRWFNRWRMFFLACSELFGMDRGEQWWVSHYLFQNNSKRNASRTIENAIETVT